MLFKKVGEFPTHSVCVFSGSRLCTVLIPLDLNLVDGSSAQPPSSAVQNALWLCSDGPVLGKLQIIHFQYVSGVGKVMPKYGNMENIMHFP